MKIKNNDFFKKNKTIKQIMLVLLISSILISISDLVQGYIQGDVMGCYKKRYENFTVGDYSFCQTPDISIQNPTVPEPVPLF